MSTEPTESPPRPESNGHSSPLAKSAHAEAEKLADAGKRSFHRAEQRFEKLEHEVRDEIREPTTGAALAGAAVVGASLIFGLPQAALGATAGYVVYRMLKKRRGSGSANRP